MNTPQVTEQLGIMEGSIIWITPGIEPTQSDRNPAHVIYKAQREGEFWRTAKSGLVCILKDARPGRPVSLKVTGLPMAGMYVFVEAE